MYLSLIYYVDADGPTFSALMEDYTALAGATNAIPDPAPPCRPPSLEPTGALATDFDLPRKCFSLSLSSSECITLMCSVRELGGGGWRGICSGGSQGHGYGLVSVHTLTSSCYVYVLYFVHQVRSAGGRLPHHQTREGRVSPISSSADFVVSPRLIVSPATFYVTFAAH